MLFALADLVALVIGATTVVVGCDNKNKVVTAIGAVVFLAAAVVAVLH